MKVGIFYNSIANPAKFSNKTMLMDTFVHGVEASGDSVVKYMDQQTPTEKLERAGLTIEELKELLGL